MEKSSSLFFVGFIVVVKETYTSVACDFCDMFWTYNPCFLQLAFLALWFVNFFLTFFKASTNYGYFHYVSYGIFAHWFSSNQMFKWTVSFATEVEKKNRPSCGCFDRGLRSTNTLRAEATFSRYERAISYRENVASARRVSTKDLKRETGWTYLLQQITCVNWNLCCDHGVLVSLFI